MDLEELQDNSNVLFSDAASHFDLRQSSHVGYPQKLFVVFVNQSRKLSFDFVLFFFAFVVLVFLCELFLSLFRFKKKNMAHGHVS